MAHCEACGSHVAEGARFCANCGSATRTISASTDDLATLEFASAPRQTRPASRLSSSTGGTTGEGRFLPGRLVIGRYRIIALLGAGGMGEVYRADDLTLGQPVALKFLPEQAARDESLLERFRNEVRTARKVSHPNVCRVYDVGEADGAPFFTMEYVDGEDLASLLRRIGRLPSDKALEIARQLCAGLAAAHAKGVLHRDLKPANIMLDGRGQAVVTDFGLAGVVEQIQGADIRSGTPAYMSPEQLEGREVSLQSDIYALGLVLYEIFTGKRAFSAESLPDMIRSRTESAPSKPTSLVKDLDPAVERVILRCLENDPAKRPASVLTVAAALPGGDPLAAALAAGETPSPQMIAAAGENAGLQPRIAWSCLAFCIVGLLAIAYLPTRTGLTNKLGPEQPPEVLAQKARELINTLGYTDKPADSFAQYFYDQEYMQYVQHHEKNVDWENLYSKPPGNIGYSYRQSPQPLISTDFHDSALTPGVVGTDDPPAILSGMVAVTMDTKGKLTRFSAIPPQKSEEPPAQQSPTDWSQLFKAAGLIQNRSIGRSRNGYLLPRRMSAWHGPARGLTEILFESKRQGFTASPFSFQ